MCLCVCVQVYTRFCARVDVFVYCVLRYIFPTAVCCVCLCPPASATLRCARFAHPTKLDSVRERESAQRNIFYAACFWCALRSEHGSSPRDDDARLHYCYCEHEPTNKQWFVCFCKQLRNCPPSCCKSHNRNWPTTRTFTVVAARRTQLSFSQNSIFRWPHAAMRPTHQAAPHMAHAYATTYYYNYYDRNNYTCTRIKLRARIAGVALRFAQFKIAFVSRKQHSACSSKETCRRVKISL